MEKRIIMIITIFSKNKQQHLHFFNKFSIKIKRKDFSWNYFDVKKNWVWYDLEIINQQQKNQDLIFITIFQCFIFQSILSFYYHLWTHQYRYRCMNQQLILANISLSKAVRDTVRLKTKLSIFQNKTAKKSQQI